MDRACCGVVDHGPLSAISVGNGEARLARFRSVARPRTGTILNTALSLHIYKLHTLLSLPVTLFLKSIMPHSH